MKEILRVIAKMAVRIALVCADHPDELMVLIRAVKGRKEQTQTPAKADVP